MNLTFKQIDSLEAGRELDALIAKNIFNQDVEPVFIKSTPLNEIKLVPGSFFYTEDHFAYPEVETYSMEIAAAWKVVEKMIEIDPDRWDLECETSWHYKSSKEMALFICKAALMSLVHRENIA